MRKVVYAARATDPQDRRALVNEINDKLWDAMNSFATNEGFSEEDIPEYFYLEVEPFSSYMIVEVRAELSYNGMSNLSFELDPILQEYDADAYFDMDEPGIMSAHVNV